MINKSAHIKRKNGAHYALRRGAKHSSPRLLPGHTLYLSDIDPRGLLPRKVRTEIVLLYYLTVIITQSQPNVNI